MNDTFNDKSYSESVDVSQIRFAVIAPVILGLFTEATKTAYYKNVSEKPLKLPDGKEVLYNFNTFEKWESAYRKGGMDALMPKQRSDAGSSRVITDTAIREIYRLKEIFPRINATLIYSKLVADGFLKKSEASLSAIQRFIKKNDLKSPRALNVKDRKAFEEEFFGDMFQADTCHSIYITENGVKRALEHPLRLLPFLSLYKAYSFKGRKPAVEPKLLFKVLTYSYMNNIYSSRKIETACKRDINFMWLLEGNKCPDHSTIARFRKIYLSTAVEDLFYQFILHLKEIGEIRFENLFVDGTKIEANANKYTFVWNKVVKKNEAKMFDKIQTFLRDLNEHYRVEFTVSKEKILDDLNYILSFLKQRKEEEKTEFGYGIGKRKSKLQKFTEEVQSFYERQVKYDSCNEIFQGRSSYSKTDTDATFMRMKDDHMRNSQC